MKDNNEFSFVKTDSYGTFIYANKQHDIRQLENLLVSWKNAKFDKDVWTRKFSEAWDKHDGSDAHPHLQMCMAATKVTAIEITMSHFGFTPKTLEECVDRANKAAKDVEK